MKRTIYITILLVFLLTVGFSQAISLSDGGYSDLSVEGEKNTLCQQYSFEIPQQDISGTKFPIFSVKAFFSPVVDSVSKITLNFNNSGEITLWGNQFNCDDGCVARPIIAKSKLAEQNTLEICATTTDSTNRIVVFSDSFMDFYETPIFTIDKISPGTIFLGDKAEMHIVAKNIGSKDANVFVQFIDPVGKRVVKIDSFDIVEGESTARGIMRAGETKTFIYYIKPTLESSYNLPSAVLTFTNIFGESQSIYSEHPILYVVKPEQVETFIAGSNPENNKFGFKVIVKNKWATPFKGQLRISHEDHVAGALSEITIPANTEKEFAFTTNTLPIGDYNFYAIVEDENTFSMSDSITFKIDKEELSTEFYFAIAGLIVSVLLFLVIFFFWKEAHS